MDTLCYRYMSRPVMSCPGLYDPTTIMNADILAYCQKEGWCKLAFYLLSFFYYLYGCISVSYFIFSFGIKCFCPIKLLSFVFLLVFWQKCWYVVTKCILNV